MVFTAPAQRTAPRSRQHQEPSTRGKRAEAARFRRSLTLVGLSVVAPGSAQFAVGNRRLGTVVLRLWAGLVVAGGLVLWLVPIDALAGLVVRPWLLTMLKIFLFVVGVGWIALVVDAWRLGHPPALSRGHRLVMVATTLAICGLVATPLVVTARYASAAHDAVVAMFPSREAAVVSDGRLNIMLLGADAGTGRVGVRPDSINLVSVDVRSGRSVLVSLPRNLEKARFPEGTAAAGLFPDGFSGEGDRGEWMLNATWTFGEANPDLFPGPAGPGVTAVEQAVEGTLGLPVHYYVVVDLDGFRDLVDAFGGVTIRISEEIPLGETGRSLEPGLRELDGYETLWYARSRTGASDYARMSRQRCVLGAILREADPGTVLRSFTDLADASTSIVTTDIPVSHLPQLVELAWKAKNLPITTLQLVPPLVTPADPDFADIAEHVDDALSASQTAGAAPVASREEASAATADPSDQPAAPTAEPSEQPATDQAASDQGSQPTGDLESVCAYE
jgi:polyisoprenyl-teichoic acid--peptidoglycan teichoic acid transferase